MTITLRQRAQANILNKGGVPLPTTQKLMRYSKVETTMVYIETREEEMQ